MRIGLTFDEYIDLKLRPHSRADRAFHQAVDEAPEKMFPMATVTAANHLRSRGYDVRPPMLDVLVKNGVVTLAQPDVWSPADVDVAADYFEEAQMLVPYAAMCNTLGCCYADFALMLGMRQASVWRNLQGQLFYSCGRLVTYSVLGGVAGFAGHTLTDRTSTFVNLPAALSLLSGLFLLWEGLHGIDNVRLWSGVGLNRLWWDSR